MNTPATRSAPSSREASRRAFSSTEIGFLIGVPLAWAVLLLFHPTGDGEDLYPVVSDATTAWVIVHIGTLVFVPLMAAVIYVLLLGVEGTAARISRIALVPFVLFYVTFEVLIGIGVGLFSDEVSGLPAADEQAGATAIEEFADNGVIAAFETIGSVSLVVALVAAGLALWRRAGVTLAVPVLLALAAVPVAFHVPPFGQVGLALFVAAALLVVRARSAPRVAALRPTTA
jgi:hypothetical protein